MVQEGLARSRKSCHGGPEVVNEKRDMELNREMYGVRLARSRKSGLGGPEVVNEKFDKELNREMDGFRQASQIQEIWSWKPRGST